MNSARPPKKRNPDWLDTLLHTDFFGSCDDHTDHGKNEKCVFCIDCKLCCCKSCRASMTHFQHRSLQIVKYFGQDLVCLRDIRIYFDCSGIQTCKVKGEMAVHLNSRPQYKTTKALRSKLRCVECEACGRRIQIQDSPNRFCSIACKVMTNTESDGPHAGTPSSSEVGGSPHGAPSLVSGTEKSPMQTNKLVINFDLQGNPIGPNKNRLLIRGLAIVKVIVGVVYDDWRKVPNGKKHEIWENLLQEFDIPAFHRENVLTQVQDQWKTWKKNIRKNYFGTTREEILMWKDNVPLKEGIPESDWNIFVEREATPQKLDQRAQSRVNRAKKKDVHTLGRKSYAQVAEEWAERTAGTEDEGLEPNRVNLYLHARKKRRTGEFHPSVATDAARIAEIKSHQDKYSQADLETDALTQVLGREKRGRTRGMGRISKTKLKAIRPFVSELENVKNEVNQQKSMVANVESTFSEKMDTIINLLQNRTPQPLPFSFAGPSRSIPTQVPSSFATPPPNALAQVPSSFTTANQSSSSAADTGYHHIRDLKNVKHIAMGKIEEMGSGKTVHNRALVAHEAKVRVICVYPGNENEPVYLGQQGSADNLGKCAGSYVVWPIYLLEKIV
ncbi:hypothetical protein LguiB_025285 [Lonicera macranthoides]